MRDTENVIQTSYGSEITWANNPDYHGKILLFQKKGAKTPFVMHQHTAKTWFVNSGKFRVRYVNTSTGEIFEADLPEGHVWQIKEMVPTCLTCISDNGSITEVGNGIAEDDTLIVISENKF